MRNIINVKRRNFWNTGLFTLLQSLFVWIAFIVLILFWLSKEGHAEPLKFNPMQCQTDKTELKRIEMDLTIKIFNLWDKQGKIPTHTDYVVETAWNRANDAAKRIVTHNYICKSK